MADRRTSRTRSDDDERDEQPRGPDSDEEAAGQARPRGRGPDGEDEAVDQARPRATRRARRGGERVSGSRDRDSNGEGAAKRRPRTSSRRGLTAGQVARMGMREIAELIGKQPESVTGVERIDDGWLVGVEVVEIERIPSTSDLMAIYEAELDPNGELVSYHRTRRYARGREDDGDE